MTYTDQHIELFQGDVKYIYVTVYDENGNAKDISDTSYLMYVIYKTTTGEIVLTKTLSSGISLTTPLNGIFRISLAKIDTNSLLGKYSHECELTDSSSNPSTIFTGSVTIYASRANKP